MKLTHKRIFGLLIFMLSSYSLAHGQVGLGNDEEEFYSQEWVGGINFNTNAGLIGGVMVKHARHIKNNMYHVFQVEIVNVKHPKEQRVVSRFTGTTFIESKHNYLWSVRTQYGREFLLFKKAREQGVQVSFTGAGGPVWGIVAPYLVRHEDPNNFNNIIDSQQSRVIPSETVYQPVNFLQALGEANLEVGLNLKASLNFEFGITKSSVSGFEAGFNVDIFGNEIKIMDAATQTGQEVNERSIFPSVFLTFFFGARK